MGNEGIERTESQRGQIIGHKHMKMFVTTTLFCLKVKVT